MFRNIRRKNKALDYNAAVSLLKTERRGILAVNGDEGYPYAVPVNYYYDEDTGRIYFHGACAGHKADALRACDKVCFTVYGNETVKEESWAPYVQSVVIFGRCHPVQPGDKAFDALKKFAMKYYPDESIFDIEFHKSGKAVTVYEITPEHITGKEIQER